MEVKKDRSVSVALIHHGWNNSNFGVQMLSSCSVATLEKASVLSGVPLRITVINARLPSSMDAETRTISLKVTANPFKGLLKWLRAVRVMREFDLVVDTSEGDGFAGIYGNKRFYWQMFLRAAAIAAGCKVILAPQTFGPLDGRLQRWVFGRTISRCALVAARGPLSRQITLSSAPQSDVLLVPDLGFALKSDHSARLAPSDSLRIGLNVSGLLWGASTQSSYHVPGYQETIYLLVDELLAIPGLEIHLVSHVGESESEPEVAPSELSDWVVSSELAARYPQVHLEPLQSSPEKTKGLVSSFDFFIGSRMHACISAAASGTPLACIAYGNKFEDVFDWLGLDVAVELGAGGEARCVLEVMSLLSERSVQSNALHELLTRVAEGHASYTRALGDLMESCSR